ncbi:MAG TPA: HAD family phosphatase [Acidimicrobiales bacterium]|nr:HAD family phosphatase [Acidimicrobiales bacterium]
MPWELVIFDNDGVLVDSERLANKVLAGILSDLWRPTTFDQCVATYLGGTIARVRALVEEESGGPLPSDFEDRYYRELFAAFDSGLAAVRGVTGVVDRLAVAGTRFCVASSGSRQRIERSLRQVGLWDRFQGRAFSAEEVASGKPAPDLFLHAAASTGADPAATVVVEDSPLGVEAALAAGMAVIGFAAVTPPERLAGADAVVTTMEQIGDLLATGRPLTMSSGGARGYHSD